MNEDPAEKALREAVVKIKRDIRDIASLYRANCNLYWQKYLELLTR